MHLPPAVINVPEKRFAHLSIDLVRPLPVFRGFTHILMMVDGTTRWAEVTPMQSTSAADGATLLESARVVYYGVPDVLISDRGPNLRLPFGWPKYTRLGMVQSLKTAFRPQSNS